MAPEESHVAGDEVSLFLAGGITNCDNWQSERCARLLPLPKLVIFNPRRCDCTNDAAGQIHWEWRHLRRATAISFWFAAEMVQPITLFELGRWTADCFLSDSGCKPPNRPTPGQKRLFVGVHADYARRLDVETQLRYQCPGLPIVSNLTALAEQIQIGPPPA